MAARYRLLLLGLALSPLPSACDRAGAPREPATSPAAQKPPTEVVPSPSAPAPEAPAIPTPTASAEPPAVVSASAAPPAASVPSPAPSLAAPTPSTKSPPPASSAKPAAASGYSGPEPCQTTSFRIGAVAAACKEGGRPAAKRIMKGAVQKAKAAGTDMQCTTCHEDLRSFRVKNNAVADLKKWL